MADDIEDVVHVPDEVELNDGCPDQTLLFPCFRGVFQLKVCSEVGGQVDSRQGAFASRFPDRNAKKGQADETVDCQYQAGDHSNHKNGKGEERGHAVITVVPHCPPQFRSQMATDDSLERVSDLNGGELREGTHS